MAQQLGGASGILAASATAVGTAALLGLRYRSMLRPVVPPVASTLGGKDVYFGKVGDENRGNGPMDPPRATYDPYFWLRDDDKKDPKVIGYLKEENAYTEYMTKHLKQEEEALYKELLSHVKETDEAVPYPTGTFFYYTKTIKGLSYRIYCRKAAAMGTASVATPHELKTKEEVVLDMNAEATGKSHCDLGAYKPSPDHTLLAYSLDTTGFETYTILIKDIATGKLLADQIPDTAGDVCWGKDNTEIYYSTMDEAHRPHKLWRHKIGTKQSEDTLLVTEDDELFWLGFAKGRSGRFLYCHVGSSETSEVRYLDIEAGQEQMSLIAERSFGVRYDVEDDGDGGHFYIVTNADGAKNQKLCSTSVQTPGRENWTDVYPYDPAIYLTDIDCFKNHLVIWGREAGISNIWVASKSDLKDRRKIEFDEPIYAVDGEPNRIFDTTTLRFGYSSLTCPSQTMEHDMDERSTRMLKQKKVPNYDPSLYECARTTATARDGTKVMVSLVWKKGRKVGDAPMPMMLDAYGSYGIEFEPDFDFRRIALLDRGVIYAIAHIRGGGEMGRSWYEDEGKYLTKKNTFFDFIDCAKHLIAQRWTSADLLAITGRSAGGLLMGNVLNMAPELFKVAICGVPFVDLMNTMSDPSIPLTVGEWEEWGNPNEEKYYEYMLSYSPYDQVRPQAYPSVLITAGLHDPRVAYWEPAKWVARLRTRKTDSNPLLLKTDLSSGHFSASDRYKYLRNVAFDYAFALDQLGLVSNTKL